MTTIVSLEIDYETEKKLREIAFRIFGFSEKAISKAIVEAIKDWIEKNKKLCEKT
ncbi:MAG: hypothetical protein J7L47_04315 [Candidatus Odinarchaeota archaeon]|nr:hypothetical protein [Candidatus Odinarchaeota archaeon]